MLLLVLRLPGSVHENLGGRTCTMNIAGAIVKQMIFSKVDQYSVTAPWSDFARLIRWGCLH